MPSTRLQTSRPSLESLDTRICPSDFYRYTPLAETGQTVSISGSADVGTIAHLDHSPSINSAGQAAFTGYIDHPDGSDSQNVFSWSESGGTRVWNTFGDAHYVGQVSERGQVVVLGGVSSVQPGQVFPIRVDLLDLSTGEVQSRAYTTSADPRTGTDAPNSFQFINAVPGANAAGDIVYRARSYAAAATDPPQLYFQTHGVAANSGTQVATASQATGLFWQPSVADNGHFVVRDGPAATSPIILYDGGHTTTIAGPGWTELGARPSISADGRVVVFCGTPGPENNYLGNTRGVFAQLVTGTGSQIVRLAGGSDGLTGFDLDSRVSVNSTAEGQRAVTVAYTATGDGKAGVYITRLNFFGPTGVVGFVADYPAALIPERPTPVIKVGETINDLVGTVEEVAVGPAVNSRDRGDVVFWCRTTAGTEAIVRGRSQQVFFLDFDPQSRPDTGLSSQAAKVYQDRFLAGSKYGGNAFFFDSLESAIREAGGARAADGGDLAAEFGSLSTASPTLRGRIADQIQQAYTDAHVNVRVVTTLPKEGQFSTIAIGNQDNPVSDIAGASSAVDAFNQDLFYPDSKSQLLPVFEPDFAGVFVNRIFDEANGSFTSSVGFHTSVPLSEPAPLGSDGITADEVVTAIANIAIHESAHLLGLAHILGDNKYLTMRAKEDVPHDRIRQPWFFSSTSYPLVDAAASQNDWQRLAFAVGTDSTTTEIPRDPPDLNEFLVRNTFSLAARVSTPQTLQGAVLAVVPADGGGPQLIDLGAGDLSILLQQTLTLAAGDRVFFFGTTTGKSIDVYSLPPDVTPAAFDFSNPYRVLTDGRLLSTPADASGRLMDTALKVVRVQQGQVVEVGQAGTNPNPTSPPGNPPSVPSVDLYVTSDGGLYQESVTNHAQRLGTLPGFPDDLSVGPDGTIYYLDRVVGTDILDRVTIGPHDATVTPIGQLGLYANALEVRSDGAIFAASIDTLYRLDPSTGAATAVGHAPFATLSAGDIAFAADGSIYLTSDTNGGELIHVSADLTTWTRVGATGVAGLGGLRVFGTKLRAYGHNGELYDIDPATAATTYQGFLTAVSDVRGYGVGPADLSAVVPPPPPPAGPRSVRVGYPQFAVGSDAGGGAVTLYNPDGSVRYTAVPFPGFAGGVRTAAADFNRDGVADVVAGTGPGGSSRVVVLDGVTQAVLFDVAPFEASFAGGVYVAAGDLDGDGIPDLAVTPDEGGGPRADVYHGGDFAKLASFFGIDDPSFRGGARAAIADMTGDGTGDLIVAAGFGGGPRVAGFDGKSLGGAPQKIFADFFVFEDTLRNGVFVAAGDVNGDGFADLIAGGGPGGGPRVLAFDGKSLLAGQQVPVANFFGGDANSRGGIRLAVKDLDGDAKADLVVGAGADAGSRVTAYLGKALGTTAFDIDAAGVGANGVFVG